MKKAFNNIYNSGEQDTDNDQGNHRKIKPGITFFYTDISRQAAQPVQFVMKEVNDYTQHYNDNAGKNDPFACFSVHGAKIKCKLALSVCGLA